MKKIVNFIQKIFDKIKIPFRFIRNQYYNFLRSYKWFIRMWNNHDWDDGFLIQMMVDKMKDMRYQLDVKDKWFVNLRDQPLSFENQEERIDCIAGLDKAIEIG